MFSRSPQTLWRRADTEVVLAAPGHTDVHVLSESAAAVWMTLTTPMTSDGLVERLADAYRTEPSAITDDVEDTLQKLIELDAVEQG
jgi:Coenzyme PQQ synthesis protein D (PqqD)